MRFTSILRRRTPPPVVAAAETDGETPALPADVPEHIEEPVAQDVPADPMTPPDAACAVTGDAPAEVPAPPPAPPATALTEWMPEFAASAEYQALVERFASREGYMTSAKETSMLYATIRHLRPQWSLEIGTFFAQSTRIMAEAVVDDGIDGKIITLDPFGADRVPIAMQAWPEALQAVTEFRPCNSMQYFLDLETAATPKGAASPLGVAFVDGHHNFEYALYDIIRCADHLTPGGAIFVDNLEQEGPKFAVIQFLRWNPSWSLYYRGRLLSPASVSTETFREVPTDEVPWGALLAPVGLQCARNTFKIMRRGVPYVPIRALGFNLLEISDPGAIDINLSYYSVPFDFHITGQGMSLARAAGQVALAGGETSAEIVFPAPLVLAIDNPDATNVCYEVEITFRSPRTEDAYLLLDGNAPISLLP
ncbi:MAG: class I SAM-dependent methyltransferase [Acetobacteraceae bacterium]